MKRRLVTIGLALALVALLAACSSGSSSGLTGKAWQWTSGTDPGTPMPGVVPNPASYTATFVSDGSIDVKADCISSSGTYTSSAPTLTITLGPTTTVQCSPDSLAHVFLTGLQKAASYSINSGVLKITLSDGGTMSFN
jgi:heat shock protein HslJ